MSDRDERDALAVSLELDGDAVEELLKTAFNLAYTYTCEVGSTEDNARKKPGAYEMRWSGHLDPSLLSTQILRLLVQRDRERQDQMMREVTGDE